LTAAAGALPSAPGEGATDGRQPLGRRLCDDPPDDALADLQPVRTAPQSSGILLFRRAPGGPEVLLAHPGGPYWQKQDWGSWSVPKGVAEAGEPLEAVAAREFGEETGFELGSIARDGGAPWLDLGEVTLKSGKVIRAWAVEGDLDPAASTSNEIEIEWPPRTGRRLVIREVDRVAWFGLNEARRRAHPAQAAFVDRLETQLGT
jgi:predicted NUDIX family NTP pyrophosphohydrolase